MLSIFKNLTCLTFVITDFAGVIVDYSEGLKDILKLEDTVDLKLREIEEFLPPNTFNDIVNKAKAYNEVTIRTTFARSQENIAVLLSVKPFVLDKNDYYIIIIRDICGSMSPCDNCCDSQSLNVVLKSVLDLLSANLTLDETLDIILEKLKPIYNYDVACIMYLDGYNLNVKASKSCDESINIPKTIPISEYSALSDFRNTVLIRENIIQNELLSALKVDWAKEVVITPLVIKNSFFGLMAIFNKNVDTKSLNHISVLETFAVASAYSIKNAELSNVLKMQLRILKENVIERTKSLELIKSQNKKILETDRIKNEFLAHMSHELRTPLNAIIGFSEALKLKFFGDLTPKQEEYISDIHASGIHLLGMINDMLDLSKIEAKKMKLDAKDFSIELAVNEVINVVIALADKKNINIDNDYQHTMENINADHKKFQQILYNLLSNAIKFTPEGGNVTVYTTDAEISGYPAVNINIIDNGIGISKEDQEKIFDKFHQVDNIYTRSQGGSGLGLTITKELVEMHKGLIKLDSKPNKGTQFSVILPCNGQLLI